MDGLVLTYPLRGRMFYGRVTWENSRVLCDHDTAGGWKAARWRWRVEEISASGSGMCRASAGDFKLVLAGLAWQLIGAANQLGNSQLQDGGVMKTTASVTSIERWEDLLDGLGMDGWIEGSAHETTCTCAAIPPRGAEKREAGRPGLLDRTGQGGC